MFKIFESIKLKKLQKEYNELLEEKNKYKDIAKGWQERCSTESFNLRQQIKTTYTFRTNF